MTIDIEQFRKQAEILRVNSAVRAAEWLTAAIDEIESLRQAAAPAEPKVDPDIAFAILACRLTGWDGVARRLEQGWKPDRDTNEGKLVELAASHRQSNEATRLRAALEQIASTRIAGWGADGAVKSFNDVIAFAARSLESK